MKKTTLLHDSNVQVLTFERRRNMSLHYNVCMMHLLFIYFNLIISLGEIFAKIIISFIQIFMGNYQSRIKCLLRKLLHFCDKSYLHFQKKIEQNGIIRFIQIERATVCPVKLTFFLKITTCNGFDKGFRVQLSVENCRAQNGNNFGSLK